MKKPLMCLLCILFLACTSVALGAEETVNINYVASDMKGTSRWRAESQIKNITPGIYLMTEKAQGIYSSFDGFVSWIAELKFKRTENNIRPISLDKRVFDSDGKMIRREKQEFDLANNIGVCSHEEFDKNIYRSKKFRFNKNVITRLSLALYAQKFLESGKMSEALQMVSEEPNVYNIELTRAGKEIVEVNGQKIEAYRLCIDPELGMFNFVKAFLPKSYGWCSVEPKYEWIGYTGLEGGINSEKVKILIEKL
ncbi:MAG: hypothetical protein PHI59_08950 [Candidatus Omnitrophica bacterium]|nr:hypothetical protein [Candidatus Omnitrophota bacterium]